MPLYWLNGALPVRLICHQDVMAPQCIIFFCHTAPVPELHLPNPNPFIPTEFGLKPRVTPVLLQDKSSPTASIAGETSVLVEDLQPIEKKRRGYPVRLAGTEDVVFWYKQDNLFDMPKVYIALQVRVIKHVLPLDWRES